MKIVINKQQGEFSLSEEAIQLLNKKEFTRDDPDLVKIVEILKEKANGKNAKLKIVEIPDGTNWKIKDYYGLEWIIEEKNWS